jgi:hypothetical protein
MPSTLTRQFALAAGAVAIVGMGALSACSSTKEKPYETTAPSPGSSAPASPNTPSPTEKAVGPGAGGNSFSPSVKARPAPTALPGNVVTGG